MYSQLDEEKYILEFFGTNTHGRFLDVGAFDGKIFSNTRALFERGWGGVLVEASPKCFVKLQELYEGVERVKLVCACVLPQVHEPVARFLDNTGAVATTLDAHAKLWGESTYKMQFTEIFVGAVTLADLISKFGPFDFINIDLEGISEAVLMDAQQHWNWLSRCQLLCVERDGEAGVTQMLAPYGFSVIKEFPEGGNTLYGRAKPCSSVS